MKRGRRIGGGPRKHPVRLKAAFALLLFLGGTASGQDSVRVTLSNELPASEKPGSIKLQTNYKRHREFSVSAEGSERAFEASPDHSIFHTNYAWDAETRAQQHDIAASQLSTLRWLQVFAVTLKAVALICVLIGVALLIRERRKA